MEEIITDKYRCYHFGNFYLSSIQQGIQSAHAQMELFNKYTPNLGNDNEVEDTPAIDMLFDWSVNHKTMICLNGGMNSDLTDILISFTEMEDNIYPWSYFCEYRQALSGIITNVAIVLPARIYNTAENIRKKIYIIDSGNVIIDTTSAYRELFSDFDIYLINLLNKCSLAR